MCLNWISDTPKQLKSYKERYGWKLVKQIDENKYQSKFYDFNYTKNKWHEAISESNFETTEYSKNIKPPIFNRYYNMFIQDKKVSTKSKYYPGFHIWLKKPNNLASYYYDDNYILKKVQFSNIVVTGYEGQNPVVVARKIKIS